MFDILNIFVLEGRLEEYENMPPPEPAAPAASMGMQSSMSMTSLANGMAKKEREKGEGKIQNN